jgi:hypothetical protein
VKYYTDQEILDMIESKEVTKLVAERFNQKDRTVQHAQERLTVAAEHIGHQFITDLIQEQY